MEVGPYKRTSKWTFGRSYARKLKHSLPPTQPILCSAAIAYQTSILEVLRTKKTQVNPSRKENSAAIETG